ncbi:MAG: cation-translocating P-type ATPase [Lachnospiraceae bacterium]|nr:cation-translocating P-type ATPase [Lachnospiraceae bacterium]
MKKLEELLELGGTKKDIALLIISAIALVISLFDLVPLPFNAAWVAIILCGIPIILEAVIGLVTAFDIKADVLVSIALIASVIIGEDFAAGEVAVIMQLGALLEDLTVAKARAGIEKLVHLTPRTARIILDGKEQEISAELVKVGNLIRVLPGETIPVDGVIVEGQTSINQAVMTGESIPVDKTIGDVVSSGTVNQFGAFDMKATKVGENSSIQRMIRLVQSADAGKAKIVGVADRWATWIVVIALTSALLTGIFTGEIIRAVTILVVFCPCALVLATPTAIMAAIGNATKHGFLVKEGDALERLASVDLITFDKTGTLTYGTPELIDVHSFYQKFSDDQLLFYIVSAEKKSEHPLGKAIVKAFNDKVKKDIQVELLPEMNETEFQMIPGRGVTAVINGNQMLVGNLEMLKEYGISLLEEASVYAENQIKEGCTVIYAAMNNEFVGVAVLSDTLRDESIAMIAELEKNHVEPVLLTGDNEKAAMHMAEKLSIHTVKSECLPEDKLNFIKNNEANGKKVCMIGDGINDAPSLKSAHVGIAMGGIGSDIAVDAADIALINDEIKELPHLLRLSKRMMVTIKCNLTFSMALNFAAIILAITGILNPIVGALVHNAGSVFVIINSALLLNWKKKDR